MSWLNVLKPSEPVGKKGEQDVEIQEIVDAIGVTDRIIKEVSRQWKVDTDEWRMKLFPIVLEWMND